MPLKYSADLFLDVRSSSRMPSMISVNGASFGRFGRKQRHTAKRIFERLRDEHGFTGKPTIVKDYVRERHLGLREMFVPLAHPPGHAEADFGEADAIIAGVMHRAHFFVMTLPHSDACFVRPPRRRRRRLGWTGTMRPLPSSAGFPNRPAPWGCPGLC